MLHNPRTTKHTVVHLELHHRRYDLGDANDHNQPYQFNGWESYERHLKLCHNAVIILPVFGYNHSIFDIATEIRPCWWHYSWDGGRLGFAWVSKDDIRKNWNVKSVTQKYLDLARALIVAEVEEYASYLRGDDDDEGYTGDEDESN